MLTELFTSKARIRLLVKLFLNPEVSGYLRELAGEFKLSPAALKEELDSLAGAGYLTRRQNGRQVLFKANVGHPLFPEIHSIVRKYLGIDALVESLARHLGEIEAVYILDDYAQGKDTGLVDVLVVGSVNPKRLEDVRRGVETKINRTIRTLVLSPEQFAERSEVLLARPHWKVA